MFTEKHFPTSISGEELDDYLEKAWYRMGQAIFTCHFLFFDDNLYSPIWTRLPLKNYKFRKSLRRIISKVQQEFRVVVRPGVIDEEKEQLFQTYRNNFNGNLSPTLKASLMDNFDFNIYATYEVAVYHGPRLVAFSFFDLGKKSLASIKGVYDPDYASYSLGLFTMLQEIQFGIELGYEYFYPGYVVPGYDRFDYKLRIGKPEEIEYFDLKSGRWRFYEHFSPGELPVKLLSGKLMEAGQAIVQQNIGCQMLYYPAYEANIFGYANERFLESPLFLNVFSNIFPRPRFIVYFDMWKENYVFTHCMPLEDLGFYFEYSMQFDTMEARHFLDFILEKSKIVETKDVGEIVRIATHISKLIRPPGVRDFLK